MVNSFGRSQLRSKQDYREGILSVSSMIGERILLFVRIMRMLNILRVTTPACTAKIIA
jgi:hypothetical protein